MKHLQNSDIIGLNALYFLDAVDSAGEGINFYRSSTAYDRLYSYAGTLYYAPNCDAATHPGTRYTVYHSGGATIPLGKGGTVLSILTNEKYKGDAILQKCFTVDFLTKKQKVNEGEVPQYYVENSHPAIISPEVFEMVQTEVERRRSQSTRHSGVGLFAS